jgi:hypothetical protein
MPDPHERHARTGEDYESQPSRSQQRRLAATEPETRQSPGKKDRNLCKALHWKPHKGEFRVAQYGWSAARTCRWGTSWREPGEASWLCCHSEICSGCGKILRDRIKAGECPDYRPATPGELAAIEAERIRREEVRTAAWSRKAGRKPTGKQGYRKKRN